MRIPEARLLKWAYKLIKVDRRRKRQSLHFGFPVAEVSKLAASKTCDRLFVLGSGSSINELTDEQWKVIRSGDTIGINFWILHSHVPTYYMFEVPEENKRSNHLMDLIKRRSEEFRGVPFLFTEAGGSGIPELSELVGSMSNVSFAVLRSVPMSHDSVNLARLQLRFLRATGLMRRLGMIPKLRASIVRAAALGYVLGYREIVLVGVDLNNTKYFWSDAFSSLESGQESSLHRTLLPEHGVITVDRALSLLSAEVFRDSGTRLYLGSEKSALVGTVDLFNWDSELQGRK